LRIGFDCDGVLSDFNRRFIEIANDKFDKHVTPTQVTNWDYVGLYTPEEVSQVWNEAIKPAHNFWMTLEPIERIKLTEESVKHTLLFITSRVPTAGDSIELQTASWLSWRMGVMFPTVLVVKHATEKYKLFRDLHLDAYIEDKPSTIEQMQDHNQNVFIYDQPYNQGVLGQRVKTVGEYLRIVEETCGRT
jgi:uncharacterized protein